MFYPEQSSESGMELFMPKKWVGLFLGHLYFHLHQVCVLQSLYNVKCNSVGWSNSFFASSEMVSNKPGVPPAKGPPTGTLLVPDQLLCQTPAPAADPPVQQVAEAVSQNNAANIAPTPPEPTRKQGRPRRAKTKKSGPADSNQGEVGILGGLTYKVGY